jgi:hypothetical protein
VCLLLVCFALITVGILHYKFGDRNVFKGGIANNGFWSLATYNRSIENLGSVNFSSGVLIGDTTDDPDRVRQLVMGRVEEYGTTNRVNLYRYLHSWENSGRGLGPYPLLHAFIKPEHRWKWVFPSRFTDSNKALTFSKKLSGTTLINDLERFINFAGWGCSKILHRSGQIELDLNAESSSIPILHNGKRWRLFQSKVFAHADPRSLTVSHFFPLHFRVRNIEDRQHDDSNSGEGSNSSVMRVKESEAGYEAPPYLPTLLLKPVASCFQEPHYIIAVLAFLCGVVCLGLAGGFWQQASVTDAPRFFWLGLIALAACFWFVYQSFNLAIFGVSPCAVRQVSKPAVAGVLRYSPVDRGASLSENGLHHFIWFRHSVVIPESGFSFLPVYVQVSNKSEGVKKLSSLYYRGMIRPRQRSVWFGFKDCVSGQNILWVCRLMWGDNQFRFGFGRTIFRWVGKAFQRINQYVPERSPDDPGWCLSGISEPRPEYILTSELMGAIGAQDRIPFSWGYGDPSAFGILDYLSLAINNSNSCKCQENSTDCEPKISPIKRVVSSVIALGLFGISGWLLYGGTISNGGLWRYCLFIICFCLFVPFADTGFGGTYVWIRLLKNACN